MSLFQKSVIRKYLKGIQTAKVDQAWKQFTKHFHNKAIQENIRNSKEEQYQGEFLIDLFVKVLGYTKNPNPDFNLTTELKNVKGAKKTDGAILLDEKALAVIELKGTKTTDLGKIEPQAFGYKNNQPGCIYVIISNFEKLRFYIDNAVDFEEFNLFQLTRERFDVLWLCLSSQHLLKNLPKQIKEESLTQEEKVTKQLYKDYSLFRNDLFASIQKNNTQYDKLTLFKKTQKLLDRFLFIFFAEDRLLLPPNSIRVIINQWTDLRDKYDEYQPLYVRFKKYFGYMNTGHKGKRHDIFAYNGGLFASDDILDNIKIDDTLLYTHTQKLSNYDFESEVSVNILGHIFEHSLNEIEELQAELAGIETDKKKSKRKKDGVFYTPKYITKYIVDNTVGKLCQKKKEEIGIDEFQFEKDRKGRKTATLKKLIKQLEDYRKWLLELTICDPACGSGAFLNQALEFLISEHGYIDELNAKLLGESIILSDIENAILENNLFGVDINEESVDIAKLSLWLRTARKGRKLSKLNNNIKCGNSLIDDFEVAGDKAFNWEKEFPTVFAEGGFDVVIGNPPYVRQELIKSFKPYFEEHYETYQGSADLFVYFIELSLESLLKTSGLYSIIVANKWMRARYGKPLRTWLRSKKIIEVIDFGDLPVFKDAIAYPCIITVSPKAANSNIFVTQPTNLKFSHLESYVQKYRFNVSKESLKEDSWSLISIEKSELIDKIVSKGIPLGEYVEGKIFRGLTTGLNDAFVINQKTKIELEKKDPHCEKLIKPFLAGKEVKRNTPPNPLNYLIYSPWNIKIDDFPSIKEHLLIFKEKLNLRPEVQQGRYPWYALSRYASEYWHEYEKPKIITPAIVRVASFSFDKLGSYSNDKTNIICSEDKYLLGVLNSKVSDFILQSIASTKSGGFYEYKPMYISKIPVPQIGNNNSNSAVKIRETTDSILAKHKELTSINQRFTKLIQRRFSIDKLSNKLQNWSNLKYSDFLKVLKKTSIKLGINEEIELEEFFELEKNKANSILIQIVKLDKEIDKMVYELFSLTNEEIEIIEEAVNK